MIKRKPTNHGIRNKQFQFIDTNPVSKDFFRVDLPEKFYIGKNSFTIKPTENLLKGSQIQIDILDANGNNLYFEVTDILTESNSRLISVYIYPDTPFGELKIYITGITNLNGSVLWKRDITFSYTPVKERPLFKTSPKVTIQERHYNTLEQTTSRLTKQTARSGQTLTIKSNENKQPEQPLLKLNDRYVEPQPFVPTTEQLFSSSLDFGPVGILTTPLGIVSNRQVIPLETFNYDTVYVSPSFFSSSMVGGILEFNLQSYITDNFTPLPPINSDYIKKSFIYTSSIVEIIDDARVKIYPNFHYFLTYNNINYLSVKELTNFSNFTCSFYDCEITGSTPIPSPLQSYLYCEVKNLEPISGQVEYIDVLTKPYNFVGEFTQLSSVKVDKKDLFINPNYLQNIDQELQYKRYGLPNSPTDVSNNWTSSMIPPMAVPKFDDKDGTSNSGIIYLNHGPITNPNQYIRLFTTSSYDFISNVNTEYEIKFSYELDKSSDDVIKPQLDIYISGSTLVESNTKNNLTVIEDSTVGNYLGSVTDAKSSGLVTVDFITTEIKQNKLFFVIRAGQWKIRDIKIQPRHEVGFSANEMYFLLPMPDNLKNDEYRVKLKYRNSLNYSNIETNLYGLMFSGSRSEYREYTVLLNQPTAHAAPVATVLKNTLGFTPEWQYISDGRYYFDWNQITDINKVVATIQPYSDDAVIFIQIYISVQSTSFEISVSNGTVQVDQYLYNVPLTIKIYN